MSSFDEGLDEVLQQDPRYAPEAYEFIFHALHYTQKKLGRVPDEEEAGEEGLSTDPKNHVSGAELMLGARDLALQEFGLMARTVFKMWGINRTGDFGNVVFNLIEAGMMSKTDQDRPQDFEDIFDMDRDFIQGYRIQIEEAQ